jgi:hypothetical protein
MKRFRFAIDWRVLGFSACIVFIATASAAQWHAGKVRLYCDSLYTCTEAYDTTSGVLKVYVVLEDASFGVTGGTFMLGASTGFTGFWIGDTTPHVFVGSSPTGIAMGFESCRVTPPPIYLLTATYVLSGTSTSDSYIEVLPHPQYWWCVEWVDCLFDFYCAEAGRLTINPSGVPAESTTWGRIKGMYE